MWSWINRSLYDVCYFRQALWAAIAEPVKPAVSHGVEAAYCDASGGCHLVDLRFGMHSVLTQRGCGICAVEATMRCASDARTPSSTPATVAARI